MSMSVVGFSMKPELLFLFLLSTFTFAQSPVWVRLVPDRSQFFEYEQASLSCEHQSMEEWTVWRYTTKSLQMSQCGVGWGSQSSSSCNLETLKVPTTGVYWCESRLGDSSNVINITVTDEPVILHSPAQPVTQGSDVTLSCRTKGTLSGQSISFYKDNVLLKTGTISHMTLHQVSKLEEGAYNCEVGGVGNSPSSWLTVKEDLRPPSLVVSPDSSQFAEYENLTLTCVGANGIIGHWSVKRFTTFTKILSSCGVRWGTPTSQGCFLQTLKQPDSAIYWCESWQCQRSNSVNINIYDKKLTLRSPVLPVTAGDNVTLSCKATSPYGPALFYKDGYHLQTSQTGHMNLYRVTKADEGVYKCEISGREESPPSQLLVRAHAAAFRSAVSVYTVIRWILVPFPYLVSTLLTLYKVKGVRQRLCTWHNRKTRSVPVIKAPPTEEDKRQNEDYEDVECVTTEHHF
ncbi:sialoadhesin-like isoform X2 [Cynoglossus semilaevis]|uniref:sialoadhesin-like isoform X2 n=1 Tax=Cynoglossus semilaevis TaxID=244447 RepID=UPI000D627B36|nr:sialoadhesin-like isoform X2 [Cynoglossus semilaevis]